MYMTLVKWWVEPCFPPVSFPAREHAQSYLRYCVLNINDFASTKKFLQRYKISFRNIMTIQLYNLSKSKDMTIRDIFFILQEVSSWKFES